jgi:NADPH:quinone reductase-like Zn-dependent oxidoreductase
VQLATLRGMDVIATAGAASRDRVRGLGAREVLDRTDVGWTEHVRELTGGEAVAAVVNAARGGASTAMTVLADGGQLVTITSDPPPEERGITVSSLYVRPDARQLSALAGLLAELEAQPARGGGGRTRGCRSNAGARGRRRYPSGGGGHPPPGELTC